MHQFGKLLRYFNCRCLLTEVMVLAAVCMKVIVFWTVTSCSLVKVCNFEVILMPPQ